MTPRRMTDWSYAPPTGGLVNTTTAVVMKAADPSFRNYVWAAQISHDALGVATEFVIRDGAGGTVLHRGKIQASVSSGLTGRLEFNPPLKGSTNTLLEFATLTASVTGAVFANFQGFVGP